MDVETEAYWVSSTLPCHISIKCQSRDWTQASQFSRLQLPITVLNCETWVFLHCGGSYLFSFLFFLFLSSSVLYALLSFHPNHGRLSVPFKPMSSKKDPKLLHSNQRPNVNLIWDRTLGCVTSKTPLTPVSLWFQRGIWVWVTVANYITWDKKHYLSGPQFSFSVK